MSRSKTIYRKDMSRSKLPGSLGYLDMLEMY